MKRVLSSNLLLNLGVLAGAMLLIVGAAAYVSARPDPAPATNTTTYDRDYEPEFTTPTYSAKDLPPGVRKVAGRFILAAAGREDLAEAWELSHPELRAQCACSYKEWLTGNIPVQYYPSSDIDSASFEISEITPREVYLRVLLLPRKGARVKAQVFEIGLKALKNEATMTWLVNYWSPKVTIPVPAAP